jgi:TonB family protein
LNADCAPQLKAKRSALLGDQETNLNRLCKSIALILLVWNFASSQNPKPCDDSIAQYANLETQALKKVAPAYPAEPGFRVKGKVVVRIVVDMNGNVVSARSISGHPLLVPASLKAAAQWKFRPKRVNGKVIKNVGILVFDFKGQSRTRLLIVQARRTKSCS